MNMHPTTTDQSPNENLLFSPDEFKAFNRSTAVPKIIKIVSAVIVILGVPIAGLYYSHTINQPSVGNTASSSSNNQPTGLTTTPSADPTDSLTTLQAKAKADQAAADKLKSQAQQYTNSGNSEMLNALNQQASAQQALADQAAQYAADTARTQSLQKQQQAASAAQQQAIAQQQAAFQQCQQQKSSADAPIVSQINQLQNQITTLIAQIAGVPQKVQSQFANYGGTASAVANAIASQTATYNQQLNSLQNQLAGLQNQLSAINRQYAC
jgi:DNA repair exonuclease SbcCD ATPase subunit